MADKKEGGLMFGKQNYRWMAIGAGVIVLSLLLMAGGNSTDPTVFDYNQVYSSRRITIAPVLLVLGLVIEMYAIMLKPKSGTK